jgi:NTP pyrophosphatase (non-canonical NTP hydrolase)
MSCCWDLPDVSRMIGIWHPPFTAKALYFCLMSMTIKEAQKKVDHWINTTGVRYFNELTNTAILMEEVGELARIMSRKYGEQSFKAGENEAHLADEMADVLWVLICLANQCDIDLTEALKKNFDKKSQRDKERHQQNPKLK